MACHTTGGNTSATAKRNFSWVHATFITAAEEFKIADSCVAFSLHAQTNLISEADICSNLIRVARLLCSIDFLREKSNIFLAIQSTASCKISSPPLPRHSLFKPVRTVGPNTIIQWPNAFKKTARKQ